MRSDSDGDDVCSLSLRSYEQPPPGWASSPDRLTVRSAGGDGALEHGYEIENTGTGKWSGGARLVERRRGVLILLQNRLAVAVPRQIRSAVYPD